MHRQAANENGKHRYNDGSDVYALPRVTAMADKLGLKAGWALDLVEVDPG